MTLFDLNNFSEIKDPGWNVNTLKPPLKLKDVLLDFRIQWKSYFSYNIPFYKRIKFIILRVFQRIAYNMGWILVSIKYRKISKSEEKNGR